MLKLLFQRFFFCFLIGVSVFLNGCTPLSQSHLYSPPSLLPHTTVEMQSAGYWISRHLNPDQLIRDESQIIKLNQTIQAELELTKDLLQWPGVYSAETLRNGLQSTLDKLITQKLVYLDGSRIDKSFWGAMNNELNLENLTGEIPRQYAMVVQYADQRFLPTEDGLYAKAFDVDFDELQNSALDVGTPVVVLHTSQSGQWAYVESALSTGWIKRDHLTFLSDDDMKKMAVMPEVVVISNKADLYWDQQMTQYYTFARMGARFSFARNEGDRVVVLVPREKEDGQIELKEAFILKEQIYQGFLPYTPRHILTQAFKMLNEPYGWGGMYGAQDCSRFLQQVFSTVGIDLPRDSKNQIQVGELIASWNADALDFQKLDVLQNKASGGVTVLGMRGHIMLYLGYVDNRSYAIHSVWAYREPGLKEDNVFVLNKVVVSDLTLGEKSKRGSLLNRLNAVRSIGDK